MDYDKLIEHLRRRGLGNGSALGPHSGLYDEAALAIETLRADLARVTAERNAAIADMEALMWFSGEGCRICAHAVEVHKEPYVRLDCNRENGTDCSPVWRGIKED